MINKEATTFKHLSKEERNDFFKHKVYTLQDQIKLDLIKYKKKIEQDDDIKFASYDEFKNYVFSNAGKEVNTYVLTLFLFTDKLNDFYSFFNLVNNELSTAFIKPSSTKAGMIVDVINEVLSAFASRLTKDFEAILDQYDPQFEKSIGLEKIKEMMVEIDKFISTKLNISQLKQIVADISKLNNELFIKSEDVINPELDKHLTKLRRKYLSYDYLADTHETTGNLITNEFHLIYNVLVEVKKDLELITDNITRFTKEDNSTLEEYVNFSFKKLIDIFEDSKVLERFKEMDPKAVNKICTLLSKNTPESQTILRFLSSNLINIFDTFYEIYNKSGKEPVNKGNVSVVCYKVLFYSAKLVASFNSEYTRLINVLYGSSNDIAEKIKNSKAPNILDFVVGYFSEMKQRADLAHTYVNTDSFDNIMIDCISLRTDSALAKECFKAYFQFLQIMDPVITVDIRDDADISQVLEIINMEIDMVEESLDSENKFLEMTNELYSSREDFIKDFMKVVSILRNAKTPINVLKENLAVYRRVSAASSMIQVKKSHDGSKTDPEKFKQQTLKDVFEETRDHKFEVFAEGPEGELKKHPELYKLDDIDLGNGFGTKVLEPDSRKYFTVGIDTGCCQAPGLAGEPAMIDSYINPFAGVLVLEYNKVMVAQSYFHCVPIFTKVKKSEDDRDSKDSYEISYGIILDNIEYVIAICRSFPKDLLDKIYNKLALMATKQFGFKYFVCGIGYNKLNNDMFAPGKFKEDPRYFAVGTPYTDFRPNGGNIDLTKYIGNVERKVINSKLDEFGEPDKAVDLAREPLTHKLNIKK